MPTLKQLRLDANLSKSALGRRAKVSTSTVTRAEDGLPVQELKAYALVKALGITLGRTISMNEVQGLSLYEGPDQEEE